MSQGKKMGNEITITSEASDNPTSLFCMKEQLVEHNCTILVKEGH